MSWNHKSNPDISHAMQHCLNFTFGTNIKNVQKVSCFSLPCNSHYIFYLIILKKRWLQSHHICVQSKEKLKNSSHLTSKLLTQILYLTARTVWNFQLETFPYIKNVGEKIGFTELFSRAFVLKIKIHHICVGRRFPPTHKMFFGPVYNVANINRS